MSSALFERAQRFIGVHELAGDANNHPLVQWWLSLCGFGVEVPDETPWCSAFINGMAWDLRLPRSKSALARSWLGVGTVVSLADVRVGDVVIIKRGQEPQPGPENRTASGHVGLFAGPPLMLLGGNQGDGVCIASFDPTRFLGARRIES